MTQIVTITKKYPLTLCCIALVWYLSIWFLPPEEMELPSIYLLDKWTHFVMYGGTCSVLWWEYLKQHDHLNVKKLFVWGWLAPTLMGGLIELVQAYCTSNRSGEWLDLAADAIGVTIAAALGVGYYWSSRHRQ